MDENITTSKQAASNVAKDVTQLPHVPFGKRIVPNDFIRSSLFTVTNHKAKREYIKDRELVTFGDTGITYTGEELRQDDEDVWMQVIQACAQTKSNYVEFAPYTLVRWLGWPSTPQYKEKVKNSISRMVATNINIKNKLVNAGLNLSLVRKFAYKGDTNEFLRKWKVWLEPEIIVLFSNMHYSKILWDQRQKLRPLAKWLHSYYSSHAEPFAIKVATIHNASGSKTKAMKHFRATLRKALIQLVQVRFLEDFWIDMKDLVHVIRMK